uniref:Uncharacterized protein n=1 Tax=Trichuris muris TaxID=70415 RepID=A0A5S6Q9V5_TRIMR
MLRLGLFVLFTIVLMEVVESQRGRTGDMMVQDGSISEDVSAAAARPRRPARPVRPAQERKNRRKLPRRERPPRRPKNKIARRRSRRQ